MTSRLQKGLPRYVIKRKRLYTLKLLEPKGVVEGRAFSMLWEDGDGSYGSARNTMSVADVDALIKHLHEMKRTLVMREQIIETRREKRDAREQEAAGGGDDEAEADRGDDELA